MFVKVQYKLHSKINLWGKCANIEVKKFQMVHECFQIKSILYMPSIGLCMLSTIIHLEL